MVDRDNEIESRKFDIQYRHIPYQVQCQIHSHYLDLIDRKQANFEHLLKKERLRGKLREQDEDHRRITDRWAEKVLSAAKITTNEQLHPFQITSWIPKKSSKGISITAFAQDPSDCSECSKFTTDGLTENGRVKNVPFKPSTAPGAESDNIAACALLPPKSSLSQSLKSQQSRMVANANALSSQAHSISNLLAQGRTVTERFSFLSDQASKAESAVLRHHRRLAAREADVRDALTVLSCCRSNGRPRSAAPREFRWSHNGSCCSACRDQVRPLPSPIPCPHSGRSLALFAEKGSERTIYPIQLKSAAPVAYVC